MAAEPKSRTRLDPEVRRRQIAEAAARVYAEHDPAEVSFEAVAEAAGVSRSLVYSYFGDRGSLFAAAYTCEMSRLDEVIESALEDLGQDRDGLASAVRAYLEFASRHQERWHVIAAAGSSRHPAVREAVANRTQRVAAHLGGTTEAELLVSGIFGMMEAAAVHVLEDADPDVEGLSELLTQVIWAGVSSLAGNGG